MRRLDDRPARRRAVIAVAALYALLLQAFLVAIHPAAPPAGPTGVICAEHGGGAPDDGIPCQRHACCLPAQAAQPVADFVAMPAGMAVPPRRSSVLLWRATETLGPRAPPDPAVRARGPPTV